MTNYYLDAHIEAIKAQKQTDQLLRAYGLEDYIYAKPEPEQENCQCGDCDEWDGCPCGCGFGFCMKEVVAGTAEWRKETEWCF